MTSIPRMSRTLTTLFEHDAVELVVNDLKCGHILP
jgi:hypothetical protein